MVLLTQETVAAYLVAHASDISASCFFPSSSSSSSLASPVSLLESSELHGGNLNYAFVVTNPETGLQLFVKQSPPFIKCLGPDAKLHEERIELEAEVYATWLKYSSAASQCLPRLYYLDVTNKVVVMEYLKDYSMLEDVLLDAEAFSPEVAVRLGSFLGSVHASTHSLKLPASSSASLATSFANSSLRNLQLEWVFTKAFTDDSAHGPFSKKFKANLETIKAKYRGEEASNLCLTHGDLHPGSVMLRGSSVKVIDPEFAVYGPPALDVGTLLSGVALAEVHGRFVAEAAGRRGAGDGGEAESGRERETAGERHKEFCRKLFGAYRETLLANELPAAVCEAVLRDAVGFAAAEVGRVAAGFAGGRPWLKLESGGGDDAKAEESRDRFVRGAVDIAKELMEGMEGGEDVFFDVVFREDEEKNLF